MGYVLRDLPVELALVFEAPSKGRQVDVPWKPRPDGVPVLDKVTAALQCLTETLFPGGVRNLLGHVAESCTRKELSWRFTAENSKCLETDLSKENSPFTVAIAGFGWWGKHVATRLAGHRFIRLAGIVEPMRTSHAAIADLGTNAWTDLSSPLDMAEIDAIILTTPNALHEEQVIRCAQAGKHVFCEKPLGLTGYSARKSAEACRRAGVQLGIGHERRFEPAMIELRSAIDNGSLGTIMHAEAAFSHDKLTGVPKGDWRTSKRSAPAAGMTGMGIHLTDLLISFFGRAQTVQAMTASRSLGWETGDVVSAQLKFEAGMTASLSAVLHTPHFIRMHVFGSDSWIQILNDSHPDTPGGTTRVLTAGPTGQVIQAEHAWTDTVKANLEAFAAAAQGRQSYPVTMDELIHNIEVLEAIAVSAEDSRTVQTKDLCKIGGTEFGWV